nr:hypothetical protein [uncultured Cohaesibacter sp.]
MQTGLKSFVQAIDNNLRLSKRRFGASGRMILLASLFITGASIQGKAQEIPQNILDNHRATMGCWLAEYDDSDLAESALIIHLGVQTFYGLVCASNLYGDSYRIYQVEDGRAEWANLISFPQLDTKLGWYATTELQKPTWDEGKKLLRSEFPKQGSTSSCRQYSIYSWQNGRFYIAQIGLSGDCEEKESDKDLIIYPFVDEVEKGKASGIAEQKPDDSKDKSDKK